MHKGSSSCWGSITMIHQACAVQRASPWIVSILWDGSHLEFEEPLPLSFLVTVVSSSSNPNEMVILQEQSNTDQKRGFRVHLPNVGPGIFSRVFLVPKKSGGVCPMTDLKALNAFLRTKHYPPVSFVTNSWHQAWWHVIQPPSHLRSNTCSSQMWAY